MMQLCRYNVSSTMIPLIVDPSQQDRVLRFPCRFRRCLFVYGVVIFVLY